MEFKDFTAGKDDSDRRLDKITRILLADKSLTEIYKLIRKGLVKLNHKKAKAESHVSEGDCISIAAFLFNDKPQSQAADKKLSPADFQSNPALEIVFENEDLLIIDKPYDRSVHGKEDGIYKDVLNYLNDKNDSTQSLAFTPGPLHRLDRKTTGLLVFSKSLKGARWFTEGIKNHTIQKKYYGLAEGKLVQQEIWTDFINERQEKNHGFYTVKAEKKSENKASDEGPSLDCITIAKPLAYGKSNGKDFCLIEYTIKTGRKHQIRSQSALHGHPLAGDVAYGAIKLKKPSSRDFYLQAYSLTFPENELELPHQIKIELSADFIEQLQCCGIKKSGL